MRSLNIVAIFVIINLFPIGKCVEKSCQEEFVCGRRPIEHPEKNNKKYEGDAYPGQWPWIGIIYHRKPDETVEFACSGTLISEKHVLTPRLCATSENGTILNSEDVFFRIGTNNKKIFNFGYARHRRVSKIHQSSDLNGEEHNKLVILELDRNVTFNKYVQPACIRRIFWSELIITGWGLEGGNDILRISKANCTAVCDKDRGSVLHTYYDQYPLIVNFVNCFETRECSFMSDIHIGFYGGWIGQITNLDYLRMVRKGQHFDPTKQYTNLLPRRNCGNNFIGKNETDSTAQLYEFPWMAIIYEYGFWNNKSLAKCHGTLISHRNVLTSARCGDNYDNPTFVRLGEFDTDKNPDCTENDETDCAPPFKDYEVEYLLQHPDYVRRIFGNLNDIALIRTKKFIEYEDHIQPICLPVSQELRNKKLSQYVMTGWKEDKTKGTKLQKATENNCFRVTKDYLEKVKSYYNIQIKDSINWLICSKKSDYYITGLPLANLVDSKGTRYVQYGVYSYRLYRDNNSFYYTLISPYMDWVIANMEE